MATGDNGKVALAPRYIEDFSCLKGRCPDTCCAGWGIPVDRASYERLQAVAGTEKGAFIRDVMCRCQTDDASRWALLKSGRDNRCCFLEDDGLCRLYREMGEDFIPEVCTSYPRIAKDLGAVVEYSLVLSCPAVAALALPAREGLELVQLPAGKWPRTSFNARLDLAGLPEDDWRGRFFFPAKQQALAILGHRRLILEHRLLLVGLYLEEIGAAERGSKGARPVPDILAGWREMLPGSGDWAARVAGLNPQWDAQLNLVRELIKSKLAYPPTGPAFTALVDRVSRGRLTAGGDAYRQGIELCQQALAGREHLLENYVTNYFYQSKLFLSGQVFDEYIPAVVCLSLIRFILAGLALEGEDLSDSVVIRMVQLVYREVEHNGPYRKLVVDFFSRPGYPTLAALGFLLKI